MASETKWNLGWLLYRMAEETPMLNQEAALWLERASEQGHVRAAEYFGELCADGLLGTDAEKNALLHFERAHRLGSAHA
jgi:TPR repeat protein